MKFSVTNPALPMLGLFALAACGQPAETTYETDVVDESGGELIVSEVDPDAVPVDVPDTEMVVVTENETGEAPAE